MDSAKVTPMCSVCYSRPAAKVQAFAGSNYIQVLCADCAPGIAVYRVQDKEGRGPFRPGFSSTWLDDAPRAIGLEPWYVEFGADIIQRVGRPGEHYGSAVRDLSGIARWFSDSELFRLRCLGYAVVLLIADRVLAESKNQLLFARKTPLATGAEIVALTSTEQTKQGGAT